MLSSQILGLTYKCGFQLSNRLGALGFLNTGDYVARGNQGLKDQALALRVDIFKIEFLCYVNNLVFKAYHINRTPFHFSGFK